MKRTIEWIEREYNQDKYGSLIGMNFKTEKEYKIQEYKNVGINCNDVIEYSVRDEIKHGQQNTIKHILDSRIKNVIQKIQPTNVCELGCGYGFNLHTLKDITDVYGGEYSKNAVDIGNSMGYDIQEFNYYNKNDYNIIKSDTTILTCHSIEQIPNAYCFFDGLNDHKKDINYVVHFEPLYFPGIDTDIGLKRNEYKINNDYNTNLYSILKNSEDIQILYQDFDFMGMNPLNPTSILVWLYK